MIKISKANILMSDRDSPFFSEAKKIQRPVFYTIRSKGERFYYFLPLLGGGLEGVSE
jgi:hypothetical protein